MSDKKIPETLTWKAPSHIKHKRSFLWYIILILVGVGLIGFAYYTQSLMTGITFALMIVVILLFSAQAGHEVTYKITKTGIISGETLFPYSVIKKFWITYDPPEVKTLNFETSAYINNKVTLQLGQQNPVQVKLVLSQYIVEDLDMEESIAQSLARRLKI